VIYAVGGFNGVQYDRIACAKPRIGKHRKFVGVVIWMDTGSL
jgi:hypothetical protein